VIWYWSIGEVKKAQMTQINSLLSEADLRHLRFFQ
jgi:hypothetical protein